VRLGAASSPARDTAAYTRAGNENGRGLAFARSKQQHPELNFYAADRRHPSVAGTYLAACRLYASLFKKSPVDLQYTAGLSDASAKLLQLAAWETVQDYFGTAISSK
jgi:hypothetical protein